MARSNEPGFLWPVPNDGVDATRRWGKSGTVKLDAAQVQVGNRVRMTFEYPNRRVRGHYDDIGLSLETGLFEEVLGRRPATFNPTEPIGVRFSGHPDALLNLFRTLHIEYAKRRGKYQVGVVKRKRMIIMEEEE